MKKITILLCSFMFGLFSSGNASGALIAQGFTFSVADDFLGPIDEGTHFHSSTGHAFSNPDGIAEVGYFGDHEKVRGLSEYDLNGRTNASSVFVTFTVFNDGGLFASDAGSNSPPSNDFPFIGDIDVVAYEGNNLENLSDWQAVSIGSVGSFNTIGLLVGDILSFEISNIYNDAIDNVWASLGVRLQTTSETDLDPNLQRGAWAFDDFRLTTTDDSATEGPTSTVPEPTTILLLSTGLVGLLVHGRKKVNGEFLAIKDRRNIRIKA